MTVLAQSEAIGDRAGIFARDYGAGDRPKRMGAVHL